MNLEEFKIIFKEECINNNIKIKENSIEKFYNYMVEILEWNNKVNLTAIKEEKEFIIKHYIDSLIISKYIKEDCKIIDIGTGAGFPGIPLKLLNEKIDITLIDSVNKKLNVIKNITEKMNLNKIQIIHTRAEDLAIKKEFREKYDIATTRAVSNFCTILEYMLPFLKVGGKAICMKGPNFKEELEESKKAIEILGGELERVDTFNIDDATRNIVIIKKIKNTPNKYPRSQGKPLKEPIK